MTRLGKRYVNIVIVVIAAVVVATSAAWLFEFAATAFITPRPVSAPLIFERGKTPAAVAAQIATQLPLFDTPRAIPDIRFVNGDGDKISLAEFRGKVVLLNLWATWCAPCRREMPTLDRLQAELGGADFQVLALSIDRAGISAVRKFYTEIGVKHLVMYIDSSGAAARQLEAAGLPVTLLIDRQGREIGRLVGPAEWDAPEMMGLIRGLLAKQTGLSRPGIGKIGPVLGEIDALHALTFQPVETLPLTQQSWRLTHG